MELSVRLSLKHLFFGILILYLTSSTVCFTSSLQLHKLLTLSRIEGYTKLYIQPDSEGETNPLIANTKIKPQGYMSSDLSSNEDGKQGRVFGYILFALVPVLFLVPFFLSRGFEPPVDPDMYSGPTTAISTSAKVNKQ